MQTTISLGDQDFCEYHQKNPQVYTQFRRVTLQTIQKGFKRYSAKGIFEIVRWHSGVRAEDPEGFKINNNFVPFYARMFMREYPQHEEFFETRKSKWDRK